MFKLYKRIRDLREDNDYTQLQIADMLHVSQSTYSRYESGAVNNIPTQALKKLASFYNITLDELLE